MISRITMWSLSSAFLMSAALGCSAAVDAGQTSQSQSQPQEVGSAAQPLEAHPRAEGFMQRFDKDGNGTVELSELPDRLRTKLADADADKDGKLTAEELQAHHAACKGDHGKFGHHDKGAMGPSSAEHRARIFTRLDKNGDGALTADEVGNERFWSHLVRSDANRDGSVTKEELEQAHAARGSR
jgi:hypothetical protein